MATTAETVKILEEKLKQAKAKLQKEEAQKRAAESKAQRTAENRRKVLIGAMMLDGIKKGQIGESAFLGSMDKYLTRDDERALFGFPPLPKPKPPEKPETGFTAPVNQAP